ncbi:MAG TPA: hypothetical protein VFE90_18060 [Myxococcales bacterium]|jgi:hypothetical protein|nr:hypothetical protein [Myxococcales bacterium]
MAYEVSFEAGLARVPARIRGRLNDSLEEVGDAISNIPPDSVILQSMMESALAIHVARWRFEYRVEPKQSRIVVTDAVELSAES